MALILASASPRRRDLLAACSIPFEIIPSMIDEHPLPAESAAAYVQRLAMAKAESVAQARPDAIVLGADTTVTINGLILAKPESADEARQMLQRLCGREHEILTGVAVVGGEIAGYVGDRSAQTMVASRVLMRHFTAATIEWYIATGEPMDKAGAYAVQGLGGALVEWIEGSYTNAVGLPIEETLALLRRFGIAD
jgi:nucleoside triphosphate pyrophosphatase